MKSVKYAVLARVSAILLAVALGGAVILSGFGRIEKVNVEQTEIRELKEAILLAEKGHYELMEGLNSAINFGTEFTGSLDDKSCGLGHLIYDTDLSQYPETVATALEEMKPVHQGIHQSVQEALAAKDTEIERAKEIYLRDMRENMKTLVGQMEKLLAMAEEMATEKAQEINAVSDKSRLTSIVAIVAVVILTFYLYIYSRQKIANPLVVVAQAGERLEKGDLQFQIPWKSKDEIGRLADSLNVSIQALQEYVGEFGRCLDEIASGDLSVKPQIAFQGDFAQIHDMLLRFQGILNQTFVEIQSTAKQVAGISEQTSGSARALADGSAQQASSVEELSATITEINQHVLDNEKSMQTTTQKVDLLTQTLTESNTQMQEMISAMKEISHSSEEIKKILKAIEDISFQTNILALNAAVEAARAGAAGKGFAVVADEVRNLAGKSANAVKDTAKLIEDSIAAVGRGMEITERIVPLLDTVMEEAGDVVENVSHVKSDFSWQVESISQVSIAVGQVSNVVQMNAAAAQENSAASSELSEQVHRLQELLSYFKLKE